MDYFSCQPQNVKKELVISEAEKCVAFLKEQRCMIANSYDYTLLLHAFLSSYFFNYNGDTLINSKKKIRIFKMYCYMKKYITWNTQTDNSLYLFHSYIFMLYKNFSTWHINTLLRPMMKDRSKEISYTQILTKYPCLMDDYLHNKENSILYHIAAELCIIENFSPDSKILDKLYDHEKHKFLFNKEEFENYFVQSENDYGKIIYVENKHYLDEKALEQYTIISLILEFCKKNGLTPQNDKDIFTTYQIWQLNIPSEADTIRECHTLLGHGFTTDIKGFYFSITISSNYFITIRYREYLSIYVGANNSNGWKGTQTSFNGDFMITPEGKLFKNIMKNEVKHTSIEKIKEKYQKEIAEELHTDMLANEYEEWIMEMVERELSSKNIKLIIDDYVFMCQQTKNKVRLDVYSIKQLNNLHRYVATNPDR